MKINTKLNIKTIIWFCILLISNQISYGADYPLYIRFIPYTPPNLHLQTARATNAYYIPNANPGTTTVFRLTPVLASQLSLAQGALPITMHFYDGGGATNCQGSKVVTVTVKYNISGAFTTLGSETQTFNIATANGTIIVRNYNSIVAGQTYILKSGDYIQIEMRHENTGTNWACLVNEFPLNGVDTDASRIVLQTGPILSLKKQKTLISDPFNGTSNPKNIPGAVVRYQIEVSNDASASAAGDNVVISDNIPTNTSYNDETIQLDSGALTDAAGDDAGEYTGTAINVDTGVLNPGATSIIEYDITVN